MDQIAILVDAGYLFAHGSKLLIGTTQPRSSILIDPESLRDCLSKTAAKASPGARLLRVYWYDGLIRGRTLTSQQEEIANSHLMKLRLGIVNTRGQQKGVDSLIVTDLIELARNGAITDALIVSGDEDIRIGVGIAQSFGIQVHLLGIDSAGRSQSLDLVREADTCSEWGVDTVGKFMWCSAAAFPVTPTGAQGGTGDQTRIPGHYSAQIVEDVFREKAASLTDDAINIISTRLRANPHRIPESLDGPMLAIVRNRIGRDLSDDERKAFRRTLMDRLGSLVAGNR